MGASSISNPAGPMLTRKGKYGLKALGHLARLGPGQMAFVADIATTNSIPKKFLDAILGELRNAGFVHSRKGKAGGYYLAQSPETIKIGQVVRVLDGPLAPISCASKTRYQPCDDCDEATCRVRHLMLDVRNAIAEVLDNTSLADMQALGGVDQLPDSVGQIA
jgi:Rrf2 family protein